MSLLEALDLANTVAILVDHKEFKAVDPDLFDSKILIDTRGIV
jgi:UDP-N-acetyl-D-mannosaminuronic acid dehydrogenase